MSSEAKHTILGLLVGALIVVLSSTSVYKQHWANGLDIAECERELPRNQNCEMVAVVKETES